MTTDRFDISTLTPKDISALSVAKKVAFLRQLRTEGLRASTLCFVCGKALLHEAGSFTLGSEYWLIQEQFLFAALDCGKLPDAESAYSVLKKEFTLKSPRVKRLYGMLLEAKGQYREAIELYEVLFAANPTDSFPMKRCVAIAKSEGKYDEAIRILTEKTVFQDDEKGNYGFLQLHRTGDDSITRELLNLYLLTWNLSKAKQAAEDLIMVLPYDYVAHTRHAEVLYAQGELEAAANAFSQSLRLNQAPNNARAAYGLWLVSTQLVRRHGNSNQQSGGYQNQQKVFSVAKQLVAVAKGFLKTFYAGKPLAAALDLTISPQH